MIELLSLINKDIRHELDGPVLSRFNFSAETREDELDEGEETEHVFMDEREGIEIGCNSLYLIKVIFLKSGKKAIGDPFPYRHPLMNGLAFEDPRSKVIMTLGNPSVCAGPSNSRFFEATGGYDRYDHADCSIHFEYVAAGDGIGLVTLMSPDRVP